MRPAPAIGRFDGGLSQLLRGDGHGHFKPEPPPESGLVVPGDAKALAVLDLGDDAWPGFLVSRKCEATLAFRNRGVPGRHSLRVVLQGPPGQPDRRWGRGSRRSMPTVRPRLARYAPARATTASRQRINSSAPRTESAQARSRSMAVWRDDDGPRLGRREFPGPSSWSSRRTERDVRRVPRKTDRVSAALPPPLRSPLKSVTPPHSVVFFIWFNKAHPGWPPRQTERSSRNGCNKHRRASRGRGISFRYWMAIRSSGAHGPALLPPAAGPAFCLYEKNETEYRIQGSRRPRASAAARADTGGMQAEVVRAARGQADPGGRAVLLGDSPDPRRPQ
jgi:hypothetical protein